MSQVRIGIDLGGTKIEAAAIRDESGGDPHGEEQRFQNRPWGEEFFGVIAALGFGERCPSAFCLIAERPNVAFPA